MNSLLEIGFEGENVGVCTVGDEGKGRSCISIENGYHRTEQDTDTVQKTILFNSDNSNIIEADTPTDLMWHSWFAENDLYNFHFELKNAEAFSMEKIPDMKTEASKIIFYRLLYLAGLTKAKFTEINIEVIMKKNLRLESIKNENIRLEKNSGMLKTEEHSLVSKAINKFHEKSKNEKLPETVKGHDDEGIIGLESNFKKNRNKNCASATSYYFPAAQSIAAHMEPELANDRTGLKILHEMIFYWRDLEGQYYSPPNDAKKGYYSSRSNEEGNGSDNISSGEDEERKAEDDYFHEYPGEKKQARYQRKLAEAVGGQRLFACLLACLLGCLPACLTD